MTDNLELCRKCQLHIAAKKTPNEIRFYFGDTFDIYRPHLCDDCIKEVSESVHSRLDYTVDFLDDLLSEAKRRD